MNFPIKSPSWQGFFLRNSPYWEAGNDHEALSISKHKWEKRCHHRRLSLTLASGFSHYIEESIAKNIPNFPTERKPVFTWSVQHPPNNTSKVIYKSWKPNLKKKNVKFGVKFLFSQPIILLVKFSCVKFGWKRKKTTYRSSEFGTHDHLLYLSLLVRWTTKMVRCCRNPMFFKKTLILRYTDMYTKRITVNMVWNVPSCFFFAWRDSPTNNGCWWSLATQVREHHLIALCIPNETGGFPLLCLPFCRRVQHTP